MTELGDAGKLAIDRMKAERNTERERRIKAENELAKLRVHHDWFMGEIANAVVKNLRANGWTEVRINKMEEQQ